MLTSPTSESTQFVFTQENHDRAHHIIARYPRGKQASAVLALLDIAQRQNDNWLSPSAIEYVAHFLDMEPLHVYEIATFYSMFNHTPVGSHVIQVCITTPCWLCGSDAVLSCCEQVLDIEPGQTTIDRQFTLKTVECVGACVNGPVVQIDDEYYEDVTSEQMKYILTELKEGKTPAAGSQIGRQGSAPHTSHSSKR